MKVFSSVLLAAVAAISVADVVLENAEVPHPVVEEPAVDLGKLTMADFVRGDESKGIPSIEEIMKDTDSMSMIMKFGPIQELTTKGCMLPLISVGIKIPQFSTCLKITNEHKGLAMDECQKEIFLLLAAFVKFYDEKERKCGIIVRDWFKKSVIRIDLNDYVGHIERELTSCKKDDMNICYNMTKDILARLLATVYADVSFLKDESVKTFKPMMALLPKLSSFVVCMNEQPEILKSLSAKQQDRYLLAGEGINSMIQTADFISGPMAMLGLSNSDSSKFNIPFKTLTDVRGCKTDGKELVQAVSTFLSSNKCKEFLDLALKTIPLLDNFGFSKIIASLPQMVSEISSSIDEFFFEYIDNDEMLRNLDTLATKMIFLSKITGTDVDDGCDGEIVVINGERSCVRDDFA
eukprot:CFRG1754T1